MATNKVYPVTHHTASELINHMYSYLSDDQGMETQRVRDNAGNYTLVQARTKGGKFKKIVGLDKTVTLRFIEAPNAVNVEVGEAKWIDKSIVMTLSMFVLWPLTVTSGVGIYKQKKLISDLISEMDSYMVKMPAPEKSSSEPGIVEKISNSPTTQKLVANGDKLIRMFMRY